MDLGTRGETPAEKKGTAEPGEKRAKPTPRPDTEVDAQAKKLSDIKLSPREKITLVERKDVEGGAASSSSGAILKEKKATGERVNRVRCKECGESMPAGMLQCPNCQASRHSANARSRAATLDAVTAMANLVRHWVDRGPRSEVGDRRQDYRRRWKRALEKGFTSVGNRWETDDFLRESMRQCGWTIESIREINRVAQERPQNGRGRSAAEREQAGGYRYRYEQGTGRTQAHPYQQSSGYVSNARRRTEQRRWALNVPDDERPAKGGYDSAKGKSNSKTDDDDDDAFAGKPATHKGKPGQEGQPKGKGKYGNVGKGWKGAAAAAWVPRGAAETMNTCAGTIGLSCFT